MAMILTVVCEVNVNDGIRISRLRCWSGILAMDPDRMKPFNRCIHGTQALSTGPTKFQCVRRLIYMIVYAVIHNNLSNPRIQFERSNLNQIVRVRKKKWAGRPMIYI